MTPPKSPPQPAVSVEQARAFRIALWNTLRGRGMSDQVCYDIINPTMNALPVSAAPPADGVLRDTKSEIPHVAKSEIPSEEQLFNELALLYNYVEDSNAPQFTRWQMATAIYHGMSLSAAPPADGVPAGFAQLYVGDGKFALCDWQDWPTVRGYWWRLTGKDRSCRYAQTWDSHDTSTRKRIVMHNVIMNPTDGLVVDHINGDGLDNRKSNLRLVSFQQNTMNQASHGGTSKYKGVSFDRDSGLWRAYITKHGKRLWLGRFGSEEDAANAYNRASEEYHGEFGRRNHVD